MADGLLISGTRKLNRSEMFDRASRASTGLDRMGIGPGDAVALLLRNDFPFFEATFAAGRLGAYALPINWHYVADEVEYLMRDSGATALVVHADLLVGIEGAVPDGVQVLVVPTPDEIRNAYGIPDQQCAVPEGRTDWTTWLTGFEKWSKPARKRPGAMLYTSGTTGRPKGVRREAYTKQQLDLNNRIAQYLYGLSTAARAVITGPMYHGGPNVFGLAFAAVSELVILQPKFDPAELLQLIDQYRVTSLNLVPTMLVRLLGLPDDQRSGFDGSSLTHVAHAAAPCPPDVKQAMIDWWGPVVMELYGGTETGPVAGCNSAEWLAHPGTVGKAFEGSTIRILDSNGRERPTGETGEIYVQSTSNSKFTYHGKDDARGEIERAGLISLGDMGYLDEDGFLYINDRKQDMVISGGVNIYPAEIEAALATIDGVLDSAVFGIPDPEFGESVFAYVEPGPSVTLYEATLRTELESRLARYKIPRTIRITSELPREESGKIFKRKLREPFWQGHEKRV